MRWTITSTQHWAELVRFAVKCAFALNVVMFAIFSVWLTAVLLYRLAEYLWKSVFAHPWG